MRVCVVFLVLLLCLCKIGFCLRNKLSGTSGSEDLENSAWNDVYLAVRNKLKSFDLPEQSVLFVEKFELVMDCISTKRHGVIAGLL